MHRYLKPILSATTVLALTAGQALATSDGPFFTPPHGLLQPILNPDNKIVVLSGAGVFAQLGALPMNQLGQTILPHDFTGSFFDFSQSKFLFTAGGIAERLAGADSTTAPFALAPGSGDTAATAELLQTDDPGFLASAFPDGTLLKATFIGPLRIFDDNTMTFTAPTGGERLRISDFNGIDIDFTGTSPETNVAILDATGFGPQGTINVGVSGFLNDGTPDPGGSIHAHIRYELDRAGGGIPEHNPYLIELRLSAEQVMGVGGGGLSSTSTTEILDSDSIFILFDNQSDPGVFDSAVAAAVAMPEPSTAMIVVGAGLGILGIRKRK